MDKRVCQLRNEHEGMTPNHSAMTPEHQRIKESENRLRRDGEHDTII
jgi:hypothetical protein